jgi:hypothetical protein
MRSLVVLAALAQPGAALGQVNVRAVSVSAAAEVVAGEPLDLSVTFESDGVQAMPAFRWRAFLTNGGVLSGAPMIGTFGPVAVTGRQSFDVAPILGPGLSGHYTIAVVADFDHAVAERNEYDNSAFTAVTTHIRARAPNFTITAASASASERRAGEPIDVLATVASAGEIGGTVMVGAFLSRDPVVSPSDLFLGGAEVTLAAGESNAVAIAGMIPSGLLPGDYVIGVIADPDGLIAEVSDIDNGHGAGNLNLFEDTLDITTETLPSATLTIAYHAGVHARGGDGHYTFASIGALPDGLSMDRSGMISGTPARTGAFTFEVEVTSRGLMHRQSYTVEVVSTFQPLRIVTETVDDGFLRLGYQQILVAGGGEPPYEWSVAEDSGALPPGLDLGTNGVISGLPSALGTYSFGVTVGDRLGASDSVLFEVEITPKAGVLILLTEQPIGFAGKPMDYRLHATGGLEPYRWEAASTPPPGLTITEDGHISGTPVRVGLWPVRVRVIDGTRLGAEDTVLFEVDIRDDSDFHIAVTELPVVLVRSRYEVEVTAAGGAPPYTWSLGPGDELPDGFYATQGDGTTHPSDAAVIIGRGFRPMAHPFSLVVKDSLGRTRTQPYAIVIDDGKRSFDRGCVCVEGSGGSLAFLGGALLLGLRRLQGRPRSR